MACHFLKDKKISISLRRRFQFWLLGVLSVFTSFLTRGTVVGYPGGPPTAADQGLLELQCSARHVARDSFENLDI
jgi:hypothetical protein